MNAVPSTSSAQYSSPIYVNLSGDYKIPVDGEKPKVGSITGDLRLACLDAFLQSLDKALLEKKPKEGGTLASALRVVLDSCRKTKPKPSGVTLSITSKLNPGTHEITYNFNVSTTQ